MAWALWITGVPASGKSGLAKLLADRLECEWLQLDLFRKEIVPNPTFSEEERRHVYTKLAERAAKMVGEGKNVIIDATDNLGVGRKKARELIKDFAVVQIRCSPEQAEVYEKMRKPMPGVRTNLYELGRKDEVPIPGLNAPYVEEENPLILLEAKGTGLVEGWAKRVLEVFPW